MDQCTGFVPHILSAVTDVSEGDLLRARCGRRLSCAVEGGHWEHLFFKSHIAFYRSSRSRTKPKRPDVLVTGQTSWVKHNERDCPIIVTDPCNFDTVARRWFWTGVGEDTKGLLPKSAFRARRVAVHTEMVDQSLFALVSPFETDEDVLERGCVLEVSSDLAVDEAALRARHYPGSIDFVFQNGRALATGRLVRVVEGRSVGTDLHYDADSMQLVVTAIDGEPIVPLPLTGKTDVHLLVSREALNRVPEVVERTKRIHFVRGPVVRTTSQWLVVHSTLRLRWPTGPNSEDVE